MNIAICDDEKTIREQIKGLIQEQNISCRIFSYASGTKLTTAEESFDIVFLDIQMEGMNGIETAKRLRVRNDASVIIFITAIREYVFEAVGIILSNAFDNAIEACRKLKANQPDTATFTSFFIPKRKNVFYGSRKQF